MAMAVDVQTICRCGGCGWTVGEVTTASPWSIWGRSRRLNCRSFSSQTMNAAASFGKAAESA